MLESKLLTMATTQIKKNKNISKKVWTEKDMLWLHSLLQLEALL